MVRPGVLQITWLLGGVDQSRRLAAEKLNRGAPLGKGQGKGGGHAGQLLRNLKKTFGQLSLVVALLVRPGVLQVTWLLGG